MDKIYQANFHLPILLALTCISIGCTFNSNLRLPKINIKEIMKGKE